MRRALLLRSSPRHLLETTSRRCHASLGSALGASMAPVTHTIPHETTGRPSIRSRWIHIQPLPMPAVAYCDTDYYHDENDDADCGRTNLLSSASHVGIGITSIQSQGAGGSGGNGNNNGGGGGDISRAENNGSTTRFVGGDGGGTGGDGGGGPYRCPKCGTTVTFREAGTGTSDTSTGKSRQHNNCFYCAACSGWFLIQDPNTNAIGVDEKKMHQNQSGSRRRKISDPQFVMQHVSRAILSVHCCWASGPFR